MTDKPAENSTLEINMAKIEETIANLEREDISLDDSFKEFKIGMEMVQLCNNTIDKIEKQVLIITENGDKIEFE